MDHKLSITRVGWTLSLFAVIVHIVAIIRMATLTGQSRAFMEQLAGLGHPGFAMLSAGGVVILLVEAFVYGWVIAAVFVSIYNAFMKPGA
ncbi:hypothetical protein HYW17_05605 [Candidatus Uhrbacteria bacterium]|nr:hypothetical protein [Candidatus Uhrbacteria bacterium]